MSAAGCVGRVGGLAVALGVGMAVVTGTGCAVAWAEPADTTDTASTAEVSSPETAPEPQPSASPESPESAPPASQPESTTDPSPSAPRVEDRLPSLLSPKTTAPSRKQTDWVRPRVSVTAVKPAQPSSAVGGDARVSLTLTAPPSQISAPALTPAISAALTLAPTVTIPDALTPPPVPVSAPAPVVTAITQTISRLVSGLFSALSLNRLAPLEQSALWGLFAWTRRESSPQTALQNTAAPAAVTLMAAATPLVAVAPSTQPVKWVTGTGLVGSYPVVARSNDTARNFGIWGTDLGIMWDNGITGDNPNTAAVEKNEVLMLFGDTFSGPNMSGAWRSNVLLRSEDRNLADGLTVPVGVVGDPFSGGSMSSSNFARQVIYGRSGTLGWLGKEVTIIPTSGIALPYTNTLGVRQYATVMSVKSWDTPGRWTTNYSAIAYSDDNGQTWTVAPTSVRSAAAYRTTNGFVSGNQNFQQNAFVRPPDTAKDGYVYVYGTPSGRGGTVYLSRVKEADILNQSSYEYWSGAGGWVLNKPSAAKPVLPATTTTTTSTSWWSRLFGGGTTTSTSYPSAGEMSVQYNTYLHKYVMMYADSSNNVVMRTADRPEGTWSAPVTVATSAQYPGLYAPFMHPWSTGQDIYWTMSMWGDYNVVLMHTVLA